MPKKLSRPRERTAEKPPGETRERVLDVAEQLFAERGIDGVSVRDITSAAQANLGAINYHFSTKENLIVAVLERRIAPVNAQRMRGLDAAQKAAPNGVPRLETVLEVLFRPEVEQAMDPRLGGATFGKLMARFFVDPNPAVERTLHRHFEPVARRFDGMLMRVMPHLTPEDVFWRMHLLIGALHQSLLLLGRRLPSGKVFRMDAERYLKRFMAFAVAIFRAPVPKL